MPWSSRLLHYQLDHGVDMQQAKTNSHDRRVPSVIFYELDVRWSCILLCWYHCLVGSVHGGIHCPCWYSWTNLFYFSNQSLYFAFVCVLVPSSIKAIKACRVVVSICLVKFENVEWKKDFLRSSIIWMLLPFLCSDLTLL